MRSLLTFATLAALSLPLFAANADSAEIETAAKKTAGAWQLSFTTPDGVDREPVILVGRQHQELVAWYVEDGNPEPFKSVKLDEESLVLTVRPKDHQHIEVTFNAKLENENACIGEATYRTDDGESGSWEFKGRRMTAADVDESHEWQLQFVSPDDRQREALVTVVERNNELYAWYTSAEFELPAKEISVDGDRVVMSLAAKTPDGREIEVSFRGTVDGDQIKGDVEYDLEGDTGSFSFSGKRKS